MTTDHALLLNDTMWTSQVNFKPRKATVTYTHTSKYPSLMDKDFGACAADIQSGDY